MKIYVKTGILSTEQLSREQTGYTEKQIVIFNSSNIIKYKYRRAAAKQQTHENYRQTRQITPALQWLVCWMCGIQYNLRKLSYLCGQYPCFWLLKGHVLKKSTANSYSVFKLNAKCYGKSIKHMVIHFSDAVTQTTIT